MCAPAAIAAATLAISATQGVVGYMGQTQQYNAQMEAFKQNIQNARSATFAQWDSTNLRIEQEGAASEQQKFENNIETRKAAATAQTAAGEAGVSGLSVDAVLRDIYAKGGRANASVDENLQMTRGYLDAEKQSQKAAGQNQINSMPQPEKPSFAPVLLNIFGSAVGSYSQYKGTK